MHTSEISLKGKTIVITGASSGFGRGAARAFASEGANVVLAARRADLLDDLSRECGDTGGKALSVPTDVSNYVEVRNLAESALERFGGIDVWINNAGVGAFGPFERVPLADHVQVIETNLLGALYGSYYAYRHFVKQGRGTLINVASELGRHTVPYLTSYAAAKHGMVGLDDSLRHELSQKDVTEVHVCTVMPTAHDTPFFDHAANYTGHPLQAPRPLHDPQEVVDTLVCLAKNPRDKSVVGGDGVVKVLLKNLAPRAAESSGVRPLHPTQLDKLAPAGNSPGAVHWPMPEGTGVRRTRRPEQS